MIGNDSDYSDNPTSDDQHTPPNGNQYCVTTGVGEGEVNFDNMIEKSPSTTSGSCAENLAFQLFDGEEMNAQMANFIGIHMLTDLSEFQGGLDGQNGQEDKPND